MSTIRPSLRPRRGLLVLLALGVLLLSAPAFAGTYLNSAALLLTQANRETEYLRSHLNDRELADLIHKLANARLEAADGILVPKEVVQAHPHLLLVLEDDERAADAATRGEAEKFLVFQQHARDEERMFRAILKQFGYSLPELRP